MSLDAQLVFRVEGWVPYRCHMLLRNIGETGYLKTLKLVCAMLYCFLGQDDNSKSQNVARLYFLFVDVPAKYWCRKHQRESWLETHNRTLQFWKDRNKQLHVLVFSWRSCDALGSHQLSLIPLSLRVTVQNEDFAHAMLFQLLNKTASFCRYPVKSGWTRQISGFLESW